MDRRDFFIIMGMIVIYGCMNYGLGYEVADKECKESKTFEPISEEFMSKAKYVRY